MSGGVHYGEVEGLVSIERWSSSRGAFWVVTDPECAYSWVRYLSNCR